MKKNKILLSKQQEKDMRNRIRRLIFAIKENIDIKFNYIIVGSISEGKEVSVDSNKRYDIDVDITFKGEKIGAQEAFQKFKEAFKNHIRKDEETLKKKKVIRVCKEEFCMDIALVDFYNSEGQRIIVKNDKGKHEWRPKE